jgi:hypothetical protein
MNRSTAGKFHDLGFGIDVFRHPGEDFHLGLVQGRHHGTDLAVEIGDLEGVQVSNVKF